MKIFKGLIRLTVAGIVSVAIISLLLCFYDITPVHVDNPRGNTDYVWPANSIWVKATEGIAFGKYDANGFNNESVINNPDIIILGSSHMEATEVMQDENAPYLLTEKLQGEYSVYNMGISGHDFYKVCQYLPANLELYNKVPRAVIIETTTVSISEKNVDEILSGTIARTASHSTGLLGTLQKIPFFRAIYHQVADGLLDLFMGNSGTSTITLNDEKIDTDLGASRTVIEENAYNELFSYLEQLEEKYDTQIIICYHPTEELMGDGSIYFESDAHLAAFSEFADKYNISFIDMTSSFKAMYYEENHVAHGFCTGLLASGHLNKYGHAAIADALYDEIIRLEEAGELCR